MHLAKAGIQEVAPQGSAVTRNLRLARSAHEFEASLMAELLRPLQEMNSLTGEDSDAGGTWSGSALQDFASESLARAISERGGFGIAARILHQLDRTSSSGSTPASKETLSDGLKVSRLPPI